MYVDDDTTAEDTTATETDAGQDALTVEVDGEEYSVEENYDMDGDGQNDTAVVQTEDGTYVAFADTDSDGTADVAVQYDAQGNVVAGAEYDEASGEWQEENVESLPTPTGDGADDATDGGTDTDTSGTDADTGTDTGVDTTGTDTTDTTGTDTSGTGGADMTVDLPGEDLNVGPATYDTDADGQADTAVVTDSDGTTYAFTDTDGDGEADRAIELEQDGSYTISERTGDDEWTVTAEGDMGAGPVAPDASGSDAVWAER